MKIQFLRVLGIRAQKPAVLAAADDHLVRWGVKGWSCDCVDFELDWCDHVRAVAALLDDRVTDGDAPC